MICLYSHINSVEHQDKVNTTVKILEYSTISNKRAIYVVNENTMN